MTDSIKKPEAFSSSKFIADWAIRQAKNTGGTWQGLTSAHIPSYAQLVS